MGRVCDGRSAGDSEVNDMRRAMNRTLIAWRNASGFRLSKDVTYPATSRVISRTKAVRLDRKPFLLEILGAGVLGVTSVHPVSVPLRTCFVWRALSSAECGGRANVLWPLLRPTMRPDFCLTSFGILAVVVLSMELEFEKIEYSH